MELNTISNPWEAGSGIDAGQGTVGLQRAAPRENLSPEELESLKPVIKELYIDQGLTFRDVQKILHVQYNYRPTNRQFADLRRQWNMKKNTRAIDRQKILEKLASNEASEEANIGTVYLRTEKVKRWKKEFVDRTVTSQSTDTLVQDHTTRSRRVLNSHHRPHGNARELFPRPSIVHQPESPGGLKMTECLIFSVEAFMSGIRDQGAWRAATDRKRAAKFSKEKLDEAFSISSKFSGSGRCAFELIKQKSFVEARATLSNACGLVKDVLLSTHPASLGHMLRLFYDLKMGGLAPLDDALDVLREYIGRMATIVLPQGHPWRAICCVLGTVDRSELLQMVFQTMRTLSDVLDRIVGKYHHNALTIRVYFIFIYYADNRYAGELLLRQLLAGCPDPAVSHDQTFTVMGALGGMLREQGKYEEYFALGEKYDEIARKYGDTIDIINAARIMALGYYRIGNQAMAEASQRKAINVSLEQGGKSLNLTWSIHHLAQLESWVREWGRIADADKLKMEMEDLIKRDTADVADSTA